MNILSSYHPALLSMQSLHDQFPAALAFYVFCNDNGLKVYYSKGKNKGILIPKDIGDLENNPQVLKFRKTKKEVLWADLDDLPINPVQENKKLEIKQLSIQDEIEQNVLIIRVPSLNDDSFDVFAISFSKTFSNFYIPSGRNVLSSELKTTIGKTVRGQMQWLYDFHAKQSVSINRIQHAYQQNSDELDESHQVLEREQATNRDLLEKYLTQLIRNQEITLNCKIILKNGFLDRIKDSGFGIDSIKTIVDTAVNTAYDLSLDKSMIYLTPNLIRRKEGHSEASNKSSQLAALDKTVALLDRYEQAARQLDMKSERINGRNLAAELQISAPAITDAIKKHNSKIRRLLDKYPVKWPLICDFIRPIREIKWNLAASSE
ncbi:MAG: hypothetical protein GQ574_13015 [Crocinitomix sp.]|nr:hypothetical protein [Crocinitomix sp.]